MRFGIIAAHAHTASSCKDDIRNFWRKLSHLAGQLPEFSVKIILVDANASFDPDCWEQVYYKPLDDNSREVISFLNQTNMTPSDLWDELGQDVKTWRSPTGFEKALDYILVPRDMAMHLRTIGVGSDLLDLYADIDHRPLTAVFSFATRAKEIGKSKSRIDVRAMSTAAGQQKLRDIYNSAPAIPWDMHASEHWEQLQEYLTQQCSAGVSGHIQRSPPNLHQ